VLCFDGTGDHFDDDNTNVVKLFSCLKKDNPVEQAVYYQTGIGTYTPQGGYKAVTHIGKWMGKMLDQAFAWYLPEHVMSGYKFLMRTFVEGDYICLFGFSRGAYTARALAGMLHCVGLLPRDNEDHVEIAYDMFSKAKPELKCPKSTSTHHESKFASEITPLLSKAKSATEEFFHLNDPNVQCKRFKKTFSHDVAIDFVGVWDTVASVGGVTPRTLPYVSSNAAIVTFRHAIALDETRAKFQCLRWVEYADYKDKYTIDVDEVYFAGNHCDVGGGNSIDLEFPLSPHTDPNKNKPSLSTYHTHLTRSNISLRYILSEAHQSVPSLQFEVEQLRRWGIPFEMSESGGLVFNFIDRRVRFMDLMDARCGVSGQPGWGWSIVEWLPWMRQYQDPETGGS
jgi:uncharacterized protein (DUF2235 family)